MNGEILREKSQELIRFHDPYQRLKFRVTVQQVLQELNILQTMPKGVDIFSIFDAIIKRGGFEEVCRHHRIQEITLSLQYYHHIDIAKIYMDYLKQQQANILGKLPKKPLSSSQCFIQQHFLPVLNGRLPCDRTIQENNFINQHFSCLDQFYNIKTLALVGCDFNKLPSCYVRKYYIMRKWLLMTGQISSISMREETILAFHQVKDNCKICIVGLSIANALTALRLHRLGVKVTIYEQQWSNDRIKQICQNHTLLLTHQTFYHEKVIEELAQYGLEVCKLRVKAPTYLSPNRQAIPDTAIAGTEHMFMEIYSEIVQEANGRKTLFEEFDYRMSRRRLPGLQRDLINWHFNRYLLFNRINPCTFVHDLQKHHQKTDLSLVLACTQLIYFPYGAVLSFYQQLAQKIPIFGGYNKIQFGSNRWKVINTQHEAAYTHILYSNTEKITNQLKYTNYRIPELSGWSGGFPVLQQLRQKTQKWCLYRYSSDVEFKQPSNYICYCWHNVHLHFFHLDGPQVLAFCGGEHHKDVQVLLQQELLKHQPSLVQYTIKVVVSYKLKDSKLLPDLNNLGENLYSSLPLADHSNTNPLFTQLEQNTQISQRILESFIRYDDINEEQHRWMMQEGKERNLESKVEVCLKNRGNQIQKGKMKIQSRDVDIKDMFGLRNDMVKNYRRFVVEELERTSFHHEFLQPISFSFIPSLALSHPIQLQPPLWIHHLGDPIFTNKQWQVHNNMVTRRSYFSFTNPHLLVTYFQVNILMNNQSYYCIAEQSHPQSPILYHTNDQALQQKLLQHLQSYPSNQITREPFIMHPPEYMLPSVIKQIVESQLQNEQISLDSLLDNKLCNKGCYRTCMDVFDSNPVGMVIKQIEEHLHSVLLLHGLKQCSLGQLLVGYYNPIYIGWEILGFDQPMDLSWLHQSDCVLGSEIRAQFQKHNTYKYPVKIKHSPSLKICRIFPESPHRRREKQHSWSPPQSLDSYTIKTIQACLSQYRTHSLIWEIKQLIHEQIVHLQQMGSKMQLYLQMSKSHRTSDPYKQQKLITIIENEQYKCSPEQKQLLVSAHKHGDLIVCHNDEIIYTCD